jgi:hypothetical protein
VRLSVSVCLGAHLRKDEYLEEQKRIQDYSSLHSQNSCFTFCRNSLP